MKFEFEMKKISCLDCPLFNFWLSYCQAKDEQLTNYNEVPEWCPLIDVNNDPTYEMNNLRALTHD